MGNDNIKDYPPYLDYPKHRNPQTNADRIRSMTDEELAKFLWDVWRRKDPLYKECVDGWIVPFYHWLKEEAQCTSE